MKSWFLLFAMFFSACGSAGTVDGPWTDGPNPFLDPTLFRSAASYRELEVSLEAELESPGWELLFAPGDALWFAATELRRRHGLELGFPADEALEPARLEWLLDGRWLPTSQVAPSDWLRLRRFRLGAHAWAFGLAAQLVQPGQAYELQVPARAYRLLEDAGASCAEGGQLPPAGTYWSVWAPELPGCQAPLATLSLRVERLAPASPAAYPEYDALRVDGQLRAAAVFLPDPAEGTDPRAGSAWAAAEALCADLLDAGFAEQPGLARGRRFTRAGASLALSVDVLFPDRLAAMGDPAAVLDWRRAFAGAEVLLMIGPAALPAGFAFSELELPAGYQVVLATSQLEPDLLVRPLAAGGYGRLDLLTTARALSGAEPRALARGLLAGLLRGAAGEDLHWPQLLAGVERLGGAPLVASGVSTNCFTPAGTRCAEEPAVASLRLEDTRPLPIPDGDPLGVRAELEALDARSVVRAELELVVEHPYPADLEIALEHGGRSLQLWSHQVSGQKDVRLRVPAEVFVGAPAGGPWSLALRDTSPLDEGRLVRWALTLELATPAEPAGL